MLFLFLPVPFDVLDFGIHVDYSVREGGRGHMNYLRSCLYISKRRSAEPLCFA